MFFRLLLAALFGYYGTTFVARLATDGTSSWLAYGLSALATLVTAVTFITAHRLRQLGAQRQSIIVGTLLVAAWLIAMALILLPIGLSERAEAWIMTLTIFSICGYYLGSAIVRQTTQPIES